MEKKPRSEKSHYRRLAAAVGVMAIGVAIKNPLLSTGLELSSFYWGAHEASSIYNARLRRRVFEIPGFDLPPRYDSMPSSCEAPYTIPVYDSNQEYPGLVEVGEEEIEKLMRQVNEAIDPPGEFHAE